MFDNSLTSVTLLLKKGTKFLVVAKEKEVIADQVGPHWITPGEVSRGTETTWNFPVRETEK